MLRLRIALLFLMVGSFNIQAQFYNGTQMSFGKNRVQYQAFEWQFFQFKKFDTFFYKGGRELAEYTGRTADAEIGEIEKLFDYQTDDRLQFIIFNKLSDLKQTNLGLEAETQLNNTGGITRIFGNKILIYFDGNHQYEATLRYFEQLLPTITNETVWIFDDIHWSKPMEQAWEIIKNHPKVTVTVDTYSWGIVFFRTEQAKEHFVVRV